MSHLHFCDVTGHEWQCEGKAFRPFAGGTEPSVCMCKFCEVPMEQGDHSDCPIELLACPEHLEEQQERMLEAERQLAESGFEEKWRQIDTMPDGAERNALIKEFMAWVFPKA